MKHYLKPEDKPQYSEEEKAYKLERYAGNLPYSAWRVSQALYKDARELREGITPGSPDSWRQQDDQED